MASAVRQVAGVHVVRNRLWLDAVQLRDAVDDFAKMFERLERIEIPDVRAHERVVALCQRDGVLEVRAHGENWTWRRHWQTHRQRREAACAA